MHSWATLGLLTSGNNNSWIKFSCESNQIVVRCSTLKFLLSEIHQHRLSGMVFVDLRKAFDVVDHQLLLTKLRLYRVSDPSLSWFESYLCGRQQFVSIDGQRSDSTYLRKGYRKEVS